MTDIEMFKNPPLSRREREREARRREILDAAIQLFAEKGFEQTTLDEIAQKAEFGKGTIYHYFNSKEELITTNIEEGLNYLIELGKYSAKMPNLSAEQKLKHFSLHMMKFVKDNVNFFRVLVFEFIRIMRIDKESFGYVKEKRKILITVIAGIIEDGITKREFKPFPAVKIAELYLDIFRTQNISNMCEGRELFAEDDMNLLYSVFFGGVLSAPGS